MTIKRSAYGKFVFSNKYFTSGFCNFCIRYLNGKKKNFCRWYSRSKAFGTLANIKFECKYNVSSFLFSLQSTYQSSWYHFWYNRFIPYTYLIPPYKHFMKAELKCTLNTLKTYIQNFPRSTYKLGKSFPLTQQLSKCLETKGSHAFSEV